MKRRFSLNPGIMIGIIAGFFGLVIPACEKAPGQLPQPALPVIMTLETTGISSTTAISGGKVMSTGSVPLISRGVCWNREGSPTIGDLKTADGNGAGAFTSIIEGLEEATGYYVRAYAVNSVGIAYGGQEYFTTSTIPTVETAEVGEVTTNSAVSGGKVVFCGGASVTSRGVCWSTRENPTVDDFKTMDGKNIGRFRSLVTGLRPETVYYVRAYATNSIGTGYGIQYRFETN